MHRHPTFKRIQRHATNDGGEKRRRIDRVYETMETCATRFNVATVKLIIRWILISRWISNVRINLTVYRKN